MTERRRFVRLNEPLIIRYYVIGGGTQAPYQMKEAEVIDGSRGGVRLRTREALDKDAILEMEIMLPLRLGAGTYKRAVVLARVMWEESVSAGETWEYGMEFIHVDRDMHREIERFIASRLSSEAEMAGEE